MSSARSASLSFGAAGHVAAVLLAAMLPLPAQNVDEILPLPTWSPQDLSALQEQPEAFSLGGLLWPDGFRHEDILPPDPAMRRSPNSMLADGEQGSLPHDAGSSSPSERFLLFIPKPQRPAASEGPPPKTTPPHDLVEVSADFLRQCEALESDAWLLDLHALLPETQSEDLRRLLTYHAGEARTFAHVLLLDANEQLPANADLSRLAEKRLAQGHNCLAVFPLGEPWRARLFMTREIVSAVAPDYLQGILTACIQDAMQASDPVEQLQRFAIQLSIRLIWLERAHPAIFAPVAVTSPAPVSTAAGATLTDVTHRVEAPVKTVISTAKWQRWATMAGWGLVAALTLLSICVGLRRWLRRRDRNSVWILPETECKPRLGAPHCGHGGAWIRYG